MGKDLHILQHALGVDEYGRGQQYRRHFVTGPGSLDHPTCMSLVDRGLMSREPASPLTGGDDLFLVTPAGRVWMAENSPAPPKLTRSQRRYRAYLEADSSHSFSEWIRYYREEPRVDHGSAKDCADTEIPF